MFIIQLTESDADKVMALRSLCSPAIWTKKAIKEELKRAGAFSFGVYKDDNLRGYVLAYLILDELNIVDVGVHPEYRCHGIGTKLISDVLKEALQKKAQKVFLEVRKSNETAIRLYKKLGFVETGLRKMYYQDNGEDGLSMSLDLAIIKSNFGLN